MMSSLILSESQHVYDALQMSKELRKALIQALMDPDYYKDQVDPIEVDEVLSSPLTQCAACMACITFTDEDMQLGSTDHNRPFVCYRYN